MRSMALIFAVVVFSGCGPKAAVPKPVDPTPAQPAGFDWGTYPRVDIVDGSYLLSPTGLDDVQDVKDVLTRAGVPADQIDTVLIGATADAWPAPFADENTRYYNSAEIGLIRARQVTYLDPDSILVVVRADENQHLKPDARPQHDFFATFSEYGVQPIDRVPPRPGTSLDARKYKLVKLTDADRILPYGGLRYIEGVADVLRAAGVPDTAVETVFNRSEEFGWLPALRYDKRVANADAILRYKARKVADIGSNVLVLIAADDNQHMPGGLKPSFDFYFLVEAAGIAAP